MLTQNVNFFKFLTGKDVVMELGRRGKLREAVGLGEPGDGVGDVFSFGGPDPCPVAAVVVEGGADVPRIYCMWGPGGAGGRLVMD